jgi:hypothetical protein
MNGHEEFSMRKGMQPGRSGSHREPNAERPLRHSHAGAWERSSGSATAAAPDYPAPDSPPIPRA